MIIFNLRKRYILNILNDLEMKNALIIENCDLIA